MSTVKAASTKVCGACLQEKGIDYFNKKSRSKDGYDTRCRQCWEEYREARRSGTERKPVVKIPRRIKTCETCGIEFLSSTTSKTCSDTCFEKRRDTLKVAAAQPTHKTCEICGVEFVGGPGSLACKEHRSHYKLKIGKKRDLPANVKKCIGCLAEKNLSEFPRNARNKDELGGHCSDCWNKITQARSLDSGLDNVTKNALK